MHKTNSKTGKRYFAVSDLMDIFEIYKDTKGTIVITDENNERFTYDNIGLIDINTPLGNVGLLLMSLRELRYGNGHTVDALLGWFRRNCMNRNIKERVDGLGNDEDVEVVAQLDGTIHNIRFTGHTVTGEGKTEIHFRLC